ncbi:MAG: ArgE/DapE family deacylase [Gemmatimonadetes bacterium]|nr:ArgE/DapE family deacylase [Gemmatimonadota bacterium]MYG85269.1 ArgE/DapE family deacylase [Gemmatimonadota bacterium]MYJ88936.1 ArgE/DapE family deacylase [Gemmatimonadota bacterium]
MTNTFQELTAKLVSIDSTNPTLSPTAAGEMEIAAFVADWCRDRSLDVRIVDADGRPSVVAVARGTGGGRSLILNGHLDTVGVDGMDDPFRPRIEEGRMYGRGAGDMKASVAAMMAALASAGTMALRGDVIMTAVADEEAYSVGTTAVLDSGVTADAAIVTEPTNGDVVVAHKGFVWADVITQGRAAHGSRPNDGLDAITKMGAFLRGLEDLQTELEQRTGDPLLGSGSVHASVIAGGREMSSYPATCRLGLERRTVPGETAQSVITELEDIAEGCRRTDPGFKASIDLTFERRPFSIDAGHEIVELVSSVAARTSGRRTGVSGSAGWMDAALLSDRSIPTVVYGPAGGDFHGDNEWVDVASIEACTEVLTEVAKAYCA